MRRGRRHGVTLPAAPRRPDLVRPKESTIAHDPTSEAAADWVVRLAREDADPADWLAFTDWLDAAPPDRPERHREAFDRAQQVWFQADMLVSLPGGAQQPARRLPGLDRAARTVGLGLAAAGGLAAVVLGLWLRTPHAPSPTPPPQVAAFVTAAGQRRSLVLPDGSRVELNGATTLIVGAMSKSARPATLVRGEAAFDVVHDPTRPFTVTLGSVQVRVLGTAFDVLRDQNVTQVSVARGLVAVDTPNRVLRLPAGRSATITGATLRVSGLAPSVVESWRSGRRIYWNQSLDVVVADLNRTYPGQIRIADAAAGQLRFTGTLAAGSRDETVRRLTSLLSLRALVKPNGVILLRSAHD